MSAILTLPPLAEYIEEVHEIDPASSLGFRAALAFGLLMAAAMTDVAMLTPQEQAARAQHEKHAAEDAARQKADDDAKAKRDADAAEEENTQTRVFSQCEDAVKAQLRDPDGAEFPTDYDQWNKAQSSPGAAGAIYTALVKVRGTNGFGGKTLSMFTCSVLKTSGDNWPVLNIQEINADQLEQQIP